MSRLNAKPGNEREAQDRERALAALGKMRRDKISLRAAARIYETKPAMVRRYVGSALRQDTRGRYRPAPYDRISRTLNHRMPDGSVLPLTVRDSRTASAIADHSNEFGNYRNTGNASGLEQFKTKSFRVGGVRYRFLTDPSTIDHLEDAGVLVAIETLYYARIAL